MIDMRSDVTITREVKATTVAIAITLKDAGFPSDRMTAVALIEIALTIGKLSRSPKEEAIKIVQDMVEYVYGN